MRSLAIIIPVRPGDDPAITLHSLGRSEFQDFTITIQHDEWGNANKARNEGFKLAPDSEFVLFSDADINWDPKGIGAMVEALRDPVLGRHFAFAYGQYEMDGRLYCSMDFDAAEMRRRNLASTMSVIRRSEFPGWDESIDRLQDFDLWLSILTPGKLAVNCGRQIFTTARRDGITQNGKVSYADAWQRIKEKHGL